MKLTTETKIDEKVINYINSLTTKGITLKTILKSDLNILDEKQLENRRKNFQKKISKAGYKFDTHLKVYVLKSQADTSTSDAVEPQADTSTSDVVEPQADTSTSDVVEPQADTSTSDVVEPQADTSTSDVVEPQADTSTSDVVEPTKNNNNLKIKPLTKKQKKEIEEKLKENPLYYEVKPYHILEKIDIIYNKRELNQDQLCMMIYPSLLKKFKKIEKRFGYINAFYVQNCAIVSCHDRMVDLKNSDLLLQYLDFISENCSSEKRKQFTMRTFKGMNYIKQGLEKTFPILHKGDVIGFCFFAFIKCYEKSLDQQQ